MTTTSLLAGRYAPGRVLGRGATGVVFEATDQRLERTVAVTMLAAQSPERFRGQAQRLAALTHPNVVTVFDFGFDERNAWLVTELLPGPTVEELLANTGPLPLATVLAYGEQVAGALAATHDAGVVHAHLTPATVMLAGDGQCKLVDLGVARLDGASEQTTPMPLAATGLCAPEAVTDAPTPADDAYAFGALLFTVLTGQPPNPGHVAVGGPAPGQQVSAAAAHPREHRPDVPAPLDDLVAALLASDAQARPSLAEAEHRLAAVRAATTPDDAATQALATSLLSTQVLAAPAVDGPQDHRHPRGPGGRRSLTAVAAVVVLLASAALAFAVHGAARTTRRQQQTASGTPVSQPSPAPSTPSTPSPTPTASATTASPDTVSGVLSALQSTVAAAAATGDLAPQSAQELGQRLADVAGAVTDGNPGDLAHRLADLNRYLDRLGRHGQISAAAYTSIATGLQQLAAVAGAPASGNGGG